MKTLSVASLTKISSPEAQLLLSCARTQTNAKTSQQVQTLTSQSLNWPYLLQLASQHEIMPLLYNHLCAISFAGVPPNVSAHLRATFYSNTAHNLSQVKELARLIALLQAHCIPVISFKGPVLATRAYGNIALRSFRDLDILIHKKDIFRIKTLLLQQNYVLTSHAPLSKTHEKMYLQAACEMSFLNSERRVSIEPHWDFAQRKHGVFLDLEQIWKNCQEIQLEGTTVHTLSIEDALLVVCLNGAKDQWPKLKQICDVAELVKSPAAIDWDTLMQRTKALGCQRILLLGLLLAQDLLSADLPEAVRLRMEEDAVIKRLSLQVKRDLFIASNQLATTTGNNFSLWDFQIKERLREKVRYGFNLLFGPNEGDAEFLPLPVFLSWLYPFIRPFRLLTRLGRSRWQRL